MFHILYDLLLTDRFLNLTLRLDVVRVHAETSALGFCGCTLLVHLLQQLRKLHRIVSRSVGNFGLRLSGELSKA